MTIRRRHRVSLLLRIGGSAAALAAAHVATAQSDSQRSIASRATAPQYLPLEMLRDGHVRMPVVLVKRVSVNKRDVPLQELLSDVATQAGLGLSYGEDLVQSGQRVTLRMSGSAADVLAAATANTPWTVLVGASGQITVAREERVMNGSITGRVTDRATGQGIQSVQVTVEGTTLADVTSDSGMFRINGVTPGPHRLTAKRLGYQPASITAMVVDDRPISVSIELGHSAVSLSDVVITATGAERQKEIGNAVGVIDATAERSPTLGTQQLLQGRTAGVTVLGNSGQPGAGGTIRLRGVNSISQGNNPIIYVDGIRIYNGRTPTSVTARENVAPLNDIDANDIDRIEVIKGPAATTLYGTEASGGVIQIFTKHGQTTGAQWSATVTGGINNQGHVGPASDTTGLYVNRCDGIFTTGDGTKFQDPTCPSNGTWLRNGRIQRYAASVRGSAGTAVNYYVSGTLNDDESVLQVGGNHTKSVRGNLNATPASGLAIALNTSYTKRDVRWFPDGLSSSGFLLNVSRGSGSNFKGAGCSDTTITCVLNDSLFGTTNSTATNHFITGGSINYQPTERWSNRLAVGYDFNDVDILDVTPFGYLRVPAGSYNETMWNRTLATADLASTYRANVGQSIVASTSVGAQVFDSRLHSTDLSSSNFAGPGVPTLVSGSLRSIDGVNLQRVINAGFFGQEMLGWRDRLFLTVGARVDGNSAFGKSFGLQTYPKVSLSYVPSEEGYWPAWAPVTLKLRGALGESVKAPGAFDAVQTWNPVAAENGQPAFTPAQPGDPHLGPERTREVEFGFDASTWNGRLGIVYTHFHQHTIDALVPVALPPSEGFATQQLENVGQLFNDGNELSITADVLRMRRADLTLGLQYTGMHSRAGTLGGQTITIDANALTFVKEGLPAPSYIGNQVTNPDAFAEPVIATNAYLGSTFPTAIISPRATLKIGNKLTFDGLGEFTRGGHLMNAVGFQNEGTNSWQPCFGVQAAYRAAAGGDSSSLRGYTAMQRAKCSTVSTVRNAAFWVQSSNFFKLRSLSATYELPARFRGLRNAALTVSGQNLLTKTNYDGTDPESADQREDLFARRDYYVFPPPRTFLVTLRTSF